jgi:hypothetical protein
MKPLLALLLISSCVDAASTNTTKKPMPSQAEKKEMLGKDQGKAKEPNALDKKEEDCDTKAKKPVEITPESISLSGNTGCSLDEARP